MSAKISRTVKQSRVALGTQLREAREKAGKTPAAFAKSLGINANYLSKIENGSLRLPEKLIPALKKYRISERLSSLASQKISTKGRKKPARRTVISGRDLSSLSTGNKNAGITFNYIGNGVIEIKIISKIPALGDIMESIEKGR